MRGTKPKPSNKDLRTDAATTVDNHLGMLGVIVGGLIASQVTIAGLGLVPEPNPGDSSALMIVLLVVVVCVLMTRGVWTYFLFRRHVPKGGVPSRYRGQVFAAVAPERTSVFAGSVLIVAFWIDQAVSLGWQILVVLLSLALLGPLGSYVLHWGQLKNVLIRPEPVPEDTMVATERLREDVESLHSRLAALEAKLPSSQPRRWWQPPFRSG